MPECNYQIPGLYVPRTDAVPINCNGVTEDRYGPTLESNDRGDLTLYAESDDGLTWVKPPLGVFTFDGDPANNIVWDLHGAAVFLDRREPDPQRRYKAIGYCRRYRGIFLLTSPDGIHWDDRHHLAPVVERANEGAFNVTWDARTATAGSSRSIAAAALIDANRAIGAAPPAPRRSRVRRSPRGRSADTPRCRRHRARTPRA